MKKILIVDIENTIYKTQLFQIKVLQDLADNLYGEGNIDIASKYKFINFYKLFNLAFAKINWVKRNWIYLTNYRKIQNKFATHYNESLKQDNTVFLLQELKDLSNNEAYQVVYAYWNRWTKHFMRSRKFKKEYQIEIKHDNSYYWPFNNGQFQPDLVIKKLAKKSTPIDKVVFLSNNAKLLRFMNSLGIKTLTLTAKQGSLESYIGDGNIENLITDNLLEILNKIE